MKIISPSEETLSTKLKKLGELEDTQKHKVGESEDTRRKIAGLSSDKHSLYEVPEESVKKFEITNDEDEIKRPSLKE
jgi:hypothetical protein